MKLIVNPHTTKLIQTPVNEKEINITKIEFEFNDIPNEYVKKAFFTLNGQTYVQLIESNECKIPYEVLETKGEIEIGVIAYELDNDEYVERYNPSPSYFTSMIGSLKDHYENSEEITPTDKEQMEQAIQDMETKVNNIDIEASKTGSTTTITITRKDGTQETTEVLDGEDGQNGVSLEYKWSGTSLGIKREDETNYDYVNLKGDTGEPGAISLLIVNQLPETGTTGTLYFVPKTPDTSDIYDEYMWVNNAWELLGEKQITVDLSDYYTKEQTNALIPTSLSELTDDTTHRLVSDTEKSTWNSKVSPSDYSNSTTGGTIKTGRYSAGTNNEGFLYSSTLTMTQYNDATNSSFISKGTLENVITGKGLVSNTIIKNAQSTTAGDVYDVRYINSLIGDIDSALDTLNGEVVS